MKRKQNNWSRELDNVTSEVKPAAFWSLLPRMKRPIRRSSI